MSPDYATVYSIASQPTDWSALQFVLLGPVLMVVALALVFLKRRFQWEQPKLLFMIFMFFLGLIWTLSAEFLPASSKAHALQAYQSKDYSVVEGTVRDFDPMPYEGHKDECFSVQDQRFCYSDFELGAGFHQSASHGGPIRSGLPVRIAYKDGTILRLDVPRNDAHSAAEAEGIASAAQADSQRRNEADPFQQELIVAFLIIAIGWTLWWNIQWRRVMRFWVRLPKPLWVQRAFRVYFAASLVGSILQFVVQLWRHPIHQNQLPRLLEITAIMGTVVAVMSFTSMKINDNRDKKRLVQP